MQSSLSKHLYNRYKDLMHVSGQLDPNFFRIFDFEEMEHEPPDLIWNFAPSTDPYYSILNPVFLHVIDSIDNLRSFPAVLSRDGLLPLLWFFERTALPNFPLKIHVLEEFSNFIPENWRPFFGTYKIYCKKKKINLGRPTKIFLHCLAVKNFQSITHLKTQLKIMLQEIERQNLEIEEFCVFLSFRDDPFYRKECDRFNCLLTAELCRTLGVKIRFLSHKEFFNKSSFGECKIFEINQKYFVADNFINFHALSRGAEFLVETGQNAKDIHVTDLSPFHGAILKNSLPEYSLSLDQREKLSKIRELALMDDEERPGRGNIWPKAFIQYVKKSIALI